MGYSDTITMYMSSLPNQPLAQHHLSRMRPIPLRDLTLDRLYAMKGDLDMKDLRAFSWIKRGEIP